MRPWLTDRLLALILAGAVLAVYAASLSNGFVNWDDGILVYGNPIITDFSLDAVRKAFTTFDPELYVPFTLLSYQLEHLLFGLNPFVYHFDNLLLHLLNTLLAFWLLLKLTGRREVAFFAALLFGVHPLNTETVAWVSARKDLLSGAFFLGSVVAYMSYRERKTIALKVWSILLFLFGLLAKVSIAVLPVVLILIDGMRDGHLSVRKIVAKWPYFLLSIIFGVVAIVGKEHNIIGLNVWQIALISVKSTVFYLGKLVWPVKFSVFYHYVGPIVISASTFFVPLIILGLIVIVAGLLARRTKWVPFGALWYLLLLAPSFVTFYKGGEIFYASDRYAYLASIGIIPLVVMAVFRLAEGLKANWRFTVSCGVLCMAAVGAGALAYAQSLTWGSTEQIYRRAIASYPDTFIAQHNLGFLLLDVSKLDESIEHLQRAVEIDPSRALAHANLGIAYGKKGMYDEGLRELYLSLKLDPSRQEEAKKWEEILQEKGML
ncbi:MAG: tetratricopeptide repeat protein [Candidatus Peribacteraceae bacterium]|nr:tetratricopeptide repeat protein [Candidatus Peribacteraceae bacterium]